MWRLSDPTHHLPRLSAAIHIFCDHTDHGFNWFLASYLSSLFGLISEAFRDVCQTHSKTSAIFWEYAELFYWFTVGFLSMQLVYPSWVTDFRALVRSTPSLTTSVSIVFGEYAEHFSKWLCTENPLLYVVLPKLGEVFRVYHLPCLSVSQSGIWDYSKHFPNSFTKKKLPFRLI